MNVLGIHYGHNATACLVQDGVVTFVQSEERLNRIKNSTGFPTETVRHLYDHVVDPADVDAAVLFQESHHGYERLKKDGFQPTPFGFTVSPRAVDSLRRIPTSVNRARWQLRERRDRRRDRDAALGAEITAYFADALQLPVERISTVRHHDAHAYAAVPDLATDEPTLIFTADGVGDRECATVQLWDGTELRSLSRDDHRHSLGMYYAYTTELLGMRANEHEFKVMGLAPYASSERVEALLPRLRALLRVDADGHFRSAAYGMAIAAALEQAYRFQRFDVVAGAVQALTEELVLQWVGHWVARTGCHRIALGGGVFMNVKAAQGVAELPEVEHVFVVPSAGDESCAVGAAVAGYLRLRPGAAVQPLGPLYLGVEYGDDDVERAFRALGASDEYDIAPLADAQEVPKLLATGEVVARCVGRMEYGARALGNRSILADPSRPDVVEHINALIKNRDFWMPFAPSVLDEEMDRYFVPTHATFAPYMSITFDTTPEGRAHLAAAVHPRDRTARPQQVVESWNPSYHELIRGFRDLTGIGAVLNTSFNLHGEPNVCSPEDALRTTSHSGLRHLQLGSYLLHKRAPADA